MYRLRHSRSFMPSSSSSTMSSSSPSPIRQPPPGAMALEIRSVTHPRQPSSRPPPHIPRTAEVSPVRFPLQMDSAKEEEEDFSVGTSSVGGGERAIVVVEFEAWKRHMCLRWPLFVWRKRRRKRMWCVWPGEEKGNFLCKGYIPLLGGERQLQHDRGVYCVLSFFRGKTLNK